MEKKIGFIGCGKMAQAIIGGILKNGLVSHHEIISSAKTKETLHKVEEKYAIHTTQSNKEVARNAEVIFLAIPPSDHKEVIEEIKGEVNEQSIIVTIAAGITLDDIEKYFGRNVMAVRTMPNTPSLVGEGMSVLSRNQYINEEKLRKVIRIFSAIGQVEVVDESLMDGIPAISGSSPAYVFLFIEALADGAVKDGIPRETAYKLGAQAVLGAAKMVLESGKHPGMLKDEVCTPGGATIDAVSKLEETGFRSSVLTAMKACSEKVKSL
ncbi:pyrroline-5-carboxylate reductase [Cytobacillus sp. Sa5YUA1]|uniref:Pyrroline-5-carboxylate reductase n=1 Tax=Cytobacillus stercorigallinarum TaxID=2762240 RepID=A0ABR8QQU2_9BACI|nr:pyrroline-5-carboxylate reductase [Cytobacillus stercorigallinarum]MBD7937911.1 pyrroline-5-carboxylate reductase [Cytobacillus stercorigallinarum]